MVFALVVVVMAFAISGILALPLAVVPTMLGFASFPQSFQWITVTLVACVLPGICLFFAGEAFVQSRSGKFEDPLGWLFRGFGMLFICFIPFGMLFTENQGEISLHLALYLIATAIVALILSMVAGYVHAIRKL